MVINSWCALSNVRCVLRFHMSVCRECLKNVFRTVDQVFGSYLLNSHCFKQQKNIDNGLFAWLHLGVFTHFLMFTPKKNLRKRILFDGSKIKHQLISVFCFPLLFLHLFFVQTFLLPSLPNTCSYQVFWVGFRPRNPPNTFGVWKPRVCHPVDGRNPAPGIYKASK